MTAPEDTAITAAAARWRCDPATLGFATTSELSPEYRILGQEDAVDALRFGLENRIQGNNVFVRGLSGFGRMPLIHQVIEEAAPAPIRAPDRCYVYNFDVPDQPQLLDLPQGRGREFRDAMDSFAEFAQVDLPAYLASDIVKSRQKQLVAATQEKIQDIGRPFEEELRAAGLVMVPLQVGQNMVPAILPVFDGKPVQFEELQQKRLEGTVTEAEFKSLIDKIGAFEKKFAALGEQIEAVQAQHLSDLQALFVEEATGHVRSRLEAIKRRFKLAPIEEWLGKIQEDLIHRRLSNPETAEDFYRMYQVNLVSTEKKNGKTPVISVSTPSLSNLVGKIDREFSPNGMFVKSDHLMIKPGALLEADGGILILEAQDVLMEPGAWPALLRTLKTGLLEFTSSDFFGAFGPPQLRPQPIPINVKVVLVGDPDIYYLLDVHESRFSSLFKVLADFSDTIRRDDSGFRAYANVIARLVQRDSLRHFEAAAVARLIEHGARVCAQQGRLTSRFGRIADIAREASFVAGRAGHERVTAEDVRESVARTKHRADMPARHFRRMLAERTLRIDVAGSEVGQVNGLAVTSAGPLTYGFPTRITASIGPGTAGAINIERESDLSGSVHTKGFLILSGLLRHLLRLKHPMAFSASIAFEQTYGGIDGDSASGAEFCCLLSALTELPIRQDLAMTGAIDQKGNILPIGAVTEKVEGFFDACRAVEFTGTQGVIVPAANAGELMLRDDVVEAIGNGEFNVFAIESIDQALEILLGREAGRLQDSVYPADSILALAQARAHAFWEIALSAVKPPV
ncbi:MAG: Lon protease family protein [Pseudomonadota bacterium]